MSGILKFKLVKLKQFSSLQELTAHAKSASYIHAFIRYLHNMGFVVTTSIINEATANIKSCNAQYDALKLKIKAQTCALFAMPRSTGYWSGIKLRVGQTLISHEAAAAMTSIKPCLTSSVLRCEIQRLACHNVYSYVSPLNEEHIGSSLIYQNAKYSVLNANTMWEGNYGTPCNAQRS